MTIRAPGDGEPDPRGGVYLPAAVIEMMPPMYRAAPDGTLVFRNDAFNAIAGAAFPEFRAAARLTQPSTPAPVALMEVFDRLNAGERNVRLRQALVIDGEERHFRSCHVRLIEGNEPIGYAGIYTDVTLEADAVMQSARTEARFQDVIRSASDWVWETDDNLNLTYVSSRISEALETPPGALIGKHLFALGEFENSPANGPPRPDLAATLMPFRGRAFLLPDRRGRVRRIALTGVPVFDEASGSFTGYRGTGTDVTRQHEMELRARKTQKALESSLTELRERNVQLDGALKQAQLAARAKTEFLGKMSHELRTPLNAIIGFAEMSVQQVFGALNPRYLSYFRDIHSAAYHLLNIINDILDAVNIDSNRVSVSPRPIRLADVLVQARSIVAVRAEQREVDISAVYLSDEFMVTADPDRTRQVMVNLLTNAVKFTPPGGSVGVDARHVDGNLVEFTVWDTGIGIPADQHARVFESFHQVNSDILSTPTEGTGLGLTISRQLVQLMGGDIAVDSAPGRGARFSVRLPRAWPQAVSPVKAALF
jgi:signal transduction histidine kinase